MAKCFKCEKEIESAVIDDDPWEFACNAVVFRDTGNFGSALYDSYVNSTYVEIIVCDDCLKLAQGTDRLKEIEMKPRQQYSGMHVSEWVKTEEGKKCLEQHQQVDTSK